MRISVIMPCYLGEYANAATNRETKFIRAVQSFLNQDYKDKELVIVSDGCDITEKLYVDNFMDEESISFYKIPKQPLFSGAVRNEGLILARGTYICYLDSDDFITKKHLSRIAEYADTDWLYWDDRLVNRFTSLDKFTSSVRSNRIESCYIGTSSIAHKKDLDVAWGDGYGHDWRFVKQLMNYKHKKISGTGYMVCHQPKLRDL